MKKNYLLALLSAFLLWLAWPPIPYTAPLLWVAFVPLLLALETIMRSDYRKKGTKVFLLSGLTGLLWNTASIYWVFNAMNAVMPVYVAMFVALIPFGLSAVLMAFAFRLYYQLRKRYAIGWSFAGLVCFWIAYEYLHQTWDLAFPWMTLGNGFADTHQLVQWYEYTGVYGGTVWIWATNILAFLVVLSAKDGFAPAHRRKLSAALAALIVVPSAWSLYRYATYEEYENPSNVVVAQPNVDPYGKFSFITPEAQLDNLIRLSESVAQPNTEFFVWPETAIAAQGGYNEEDFLRHPFFPRIQAFLTAYRNGNILSGIESYLIYSSPETPTAREYNGIYYDAFNAAVLIENSPKLQFYHKSKLVAGVEQFPFGGALAFMKPLFKAFGGTTGGYGRQDKPSVFYSQSGIGAAPVICYESIWGDYVAQYVKQGAQFIAVVTNDGWWGNTSGKDQHLAYAKLRAIETRRWVARSANTGISAFINQRGDVVQQTTWWVPAALKQDINLNEEITFYVTAGDYLAYAGCVGSLVFALLALSTRWKRSN
ncbi:apolipoprotein N-acyltransferase [Parapedobacter koreensis]|uniref:apolipoprotein N-acyltransferase n=1 Tax=Parapedobacter koreensis TaxID=332977 RepID=UPI000B89011F|nr:apolipoprotein N-acyltransferase [Parapedobacter koreensis]